MVGDILQPTHLLLILVVALLVLGPKRLPEAGRALGNGLRDFRSAISGITDEPKPAELEPATAAPIPVASAAPAAEAMAPAFDPPAEATEPAHGSDAAAAPPPPLQFEGAQSAFAAEAERTDSAAGQTHAPEAQAETRQQPDPVEAAFAAIPSAPAAASSTAGAMQSGAGSSLDEVEPA